MQPLNFVKLPAGIGHPSQARQPPSNTLHCGTEGTALPATWGAPTGSLRTRDLGAYMAVETDRGQAAAHGWEINGRTGQQSPFPMA